MDTIEFVLFTKSAPPKVANVKLSNREDGLIYLRHRYLGRLNKPLTSNNKLAMPVGSIEKGDS